MLAMPSGSSNKKATLMKVQHKYIMQFAKHCVSTINPWVDESEIFQAWESVDNRLVLSPEQYTSPESEKNALYAEVKWFAKCASDSHSTFISRIKNNCFRIVFGSMVPSASEQGFDMFEDLTCWQLLGYDTEKKVYTSLPPILWPDGMRGIDNQYLFRNETLMKGMNEVTPGAIAFVAIMAHFVLSGNERFDKHGAHSHIQYAANFKLYKSTIIKYLNKHHMKDTIAAFNQFVFEDQGLDHNKPFKVQGINVQSNSELIPASGPSNVAVEELVGSVGAVTLSESNPVNEVEHTIQVTDEIGTGHGQGNKWQG
ncbi:hypothetical protein EDD18DRAFT_1357859 [Armillaria luteobubalina]|uniref:Uncharacterized protein n=1 Tax=Armillaria luteobubalina TaxID=153913 RepID=A0AA39PXU7_9AGAR|nr:hypothetical protein EDD18DRAFT_1357859 [Armillaria luteobubalina]